MQPDFRKHLKIAAAAEALQQEKVIQLGEDNELEIIVRQVTSIVPLQPANLLGILQRHTGKSLMDVKSSHSKDVILGVCAARLAFRQCQ